MWEGLFIVDSFWRRFYGVAMLWCMVPCVLSLFRCDGNLWPVGVHYFCGIRVESVRSCSGFFDSVRLGCLNLFLGVVGCFFMCVVVGNEGCVKVCRVLKTHLFREESDIPPCVRRRLLE